MVSKVIPAALQRTQSNVLAICVPTRFGINLYPPLSKSTTAWPGILPSPINRPSRAQTTAPGLTCACQKTVPRIHGTSNKSLDTYSLRLVRGGCQRLTSNGHNRGLNGINGSPNGLFEGLFQGLLLVRMACKFSRFAYSFRDGRNTATTKCAKCDAPSSNCSQRTTQ